MREEAGQSLVTLHRNYRSKAEIVDVANAIVKEIFPSMDEIAPPFEARGVPSLAEQSSGGLVALVEYDATDLRAPERREREANIVVRLIQKLMSEGKKAVLRLASGRQIAR
jgi:ATP-dependent exoDNAse (exonuclease V) beta subunit